MSREVHVRFCESRGVRFPPATLLVVMVAGARGDAEALWDEVAAVLAPMGLRLSEAKTRITHIDEGFDFLGFRIQRRRRAGTNQRYVYTYPSKKALAAIIGKVLTLTHRTANRSLAVLLYRLNPVLRGWCAYFHHGASSDSFGYLEAYAWRRVLRWLRCRHPIATGRPCAEPSCPDGSPH